MARTTSRGGATTRATAAEKTSPSSQRTDASTSGLGVPLVSLRDRVGNRRFEAFLQRAAAGPGGIVQRKCACGAGASGPTGDCEECRKKKTRLQTKLRIGAPGDAYEQEADRVAAEVVRMHDPPPHDTGITPIVQRTTDGAASIASAPDDLGSSIGPGRPLTAATPPLFDPRFGRDFSNVRVHADREAAQAAESIDASVHRGTIDRVWRRPICA